MYCEPVHSHTMTRCDDKPWTLEEITQQAPRGLFTGYSRIAANPV